MPGNSCPSPDTKTVAVQAQLAQQIFLLGREEGASAKQTNLLPLDLRKLGTASHETYKC